jgi:hypothetical protein
LFPKIGIKKGEGMNLKKSFQVFVKKYLSQCPSTSSGHVLERLQGLLSVYAELVEA